LTLAAINNCLGEGYRIFLHGIVPDIFEQSPLIVSGQEALVGLGFRMRVHPRSEFGRRGGRQQRFGASADLLISAALPRP
jgi:hypothetical protein